MGIVKINGAIVLADAYWTKVLLPFLVSFSWYPKLWFSVLLSQSLCVSCTISTPTVMNIHIAKAAVYKIFFHISNCFPELKIIAATNAATITAAKAVLKVNMTKTTTPGLLSSSDGARCAYSQAVEC